MSVEKVHQLHRPVVLCVLDGWGEREETRDNAIAAAETPVWDRLRATCPHSRLDASETFVGLPSGQMGNSEVGHMNLGAGRVVMQDLPRIDAAIADGSFASTRGLERTTRALRESGGTAHILGLLSEGGVHSHQNHIAALARHFADNGVPVAVHGFLDGRDTPPRSAKDFVARFAASAPQARIATLSGRYYAMDRDRRWDRVRLAYDAMTAARGARAETPQAAVDAAYAADLRDEFALPTVIGDYVGMADGDALIMANFRADRARQILEALVMPDFDGFERPRPVEFSACAGLISYSDALDAHLEVLFPPEDLPDVLGAVVSEVGRRQLRIAETEKYAHVTFFFNGGRESVFKGEDRILVPSPDVATYDEKPEMSAPEVTDRLVEAIGSGTYDLIVVNYANTDMVGHSGVFEAAVAAVEAVDACLGRLEAAVRAAGGRLLITADHGNADMMADPVTGAAHTAHTLSRVPLLLAGLAAEETMALSDGRLADVAPTVLQLMGLPKPKAMTGKSLLRQAARQAAE
jgi:2,3-bisphosphoglycerate-independent phosphoglycerate mutase